MKFPLKLRFPLKYTYCLEALKILICEYFSGGGFAGEKPPAWGLTEGYAMLKALIEDFKALNLQVYTLLDGRIDSSGLPANRVVKVSSQQEFWRSLKGLLSEVEAALMVAPEQRGVLSTLVGMAEEAGVSTLNCPSSLLRKFPGKAEFLEALKGRVKFPETVKAESGPNKLNLDYPLVVKPSRSAGCSGLSFVPSSELLEEALSFALEGGDPPVLVQKHVSGLPVSVSLIACKGKAYPLSLNLQLVKLNPPPIGGSYLGGLTPLPIENGRIAVEEALKAAEALGGEPSGFLGVDLVLAGGEAWVMDINLRLTTSYLGLRKVLPENLASLMLQAARGRLTADSLPKPFRAAFWLKSSSLPPATSSLEFYAPRGGEALLVGWDETVEGLALKVEALAGALNAEGLEALRDVLSRVGCGRCKS